MLRLKITLILVISLLAMPVMANSVQNINNNSQILYSPTHNMWTLKSEEKDNISFKKTISTGSGSYSIYKYNNEETMLNSNYEFIYNSRLIGADNENLKFYEILYKNSKLEQKLLTEQELQEIFTDVDIVKISEFNNGVYPVINNCANKKILLYNDTEANFHKYFVKPEISAADRNIKSLIILPKKGKVKFAHISDKLQPEYVIKVK